MWDSNTPPSRPRLDIWNVKFAGLDIYGWPNNNHRISSDTILELSGLNSTPKARSWGENCSSVYKGYLYHIFKRCGTLTTYTLLEGMNISLASHSSNSLFPHPISSPLCFKGLLKAALILYSSP